MSELKAGRELDALVAEKVMGWRPMQGGVSMEIGEKGDLWEDGSRKWYGKDGDPRPMRLLPSPKFSTDIASAWLVVEKTDPVFSWVLSRAQDGDYDVSMTFHATDYEIVYEATADTAPLAICRAALKAVGHDA